MGRTPIKKVEREGFLKSQGGLTFRKRCNQGNLIKPTNNIKSSSILKVHHLQRLSKWATKEVSIPSLGAFLGHRLSVVQEALGMRPDTSLDVCERCKSVLEPGVNCRVRIESNKTLPGCKKPKVPCKNYVVYTCNFCSHKNCKKGTPKGHMKAICSSNCKPSIEQTGRVLNTKTIDISSSSLKIDNVVDLSPTRGGKSLSLEDTTTGETTDGEKCKALPVEGRKWWKAVVRDEDERRSKSAATNGVEKAGGKKRRKSWTSLREIAESNMTGNSDLSDFKIPFLL